jgi:hypothetical protein
MSVFHFYLQSEKQGKVGWMRKESHAVFGQKVTGEEGSVRLVVMMQKPVLLSPKFGAKSSHIFTQSP